MSDPVYPIYRADARWEQDGEHDPRYPSWSEGLPEGRIWSSTGFYKMYREEQDPATLAADFRERWWPEYSHRLADKNPGDPTITVVLSHRESWVLRWFEHETIDVGQSDKEALASFERYVRRYEHMQYYPPGLPPEGYRCLMGAEDRWRWSGTIAENGERTPPPCRCEHCQSQGVIRIGH